MTPSKPGFPFRLFALAFVCGIVAALIGPVLLWQQHQRMGEMVAKDITITKNVGRIMLLDEALTMSASMAAATGDRGYERRYDHLDPQLTTVIHEVRASLPQNEIASFINETDAANTALVKMERQVFALSRVGRQQEAKALLASNEYSSLKVAYAVGVRKIVEAVDALIESDNRKANYILLSFVAVSVLSALVLTLTWLFAVKSAKSWVEERARAEEAQREHVALIKKAAEKDRLLRLFYELPFVGLAVTSPTSKRWLQVNDRMCEILGYGREELLELAWTQTTHPDDLPTNMTLFKRMAAGEFDAFHFNKRFVRKDGGIVDASMEVRCVRGPDGNLETVVIMVEDITERKRMEEQVRQMAFHDALTGLPNRRLLNDRLSQAMAASKRSGCYGAMMFLDLDNFKLLNDMQGHEVGDLLLIEASGRLQTCVREVDTVARFGGDEFVVMLRELNADKSESAAHVAIIAEKIRAALGRPYALQVRHEGAAGATVEHQCTASIGVALFGKHDASPDDILKWADTAMYQAKEAGRNLIRFYDSQA